MKQHLLFQRWGKRLVSTVLLCALLLSVVPVSVAAEKSVYKVNSYGELTKYRGSSNVTIRSNTSAISIYAFDKVKTTRFQVDSGNAYYKAIDGVLYNKAGTLLVKCPTERSGSFTIPSTVTKISAYAFDGCKKLTKITMSSNVKSLGYGSFYKCSALESVTLSSNLISLPYGTFKGCSSLKTVKLPKDLVSIGEEAFSDCSSLSSISLPKELESIGNEAFSGCEELTQLKLPTSITSLGNYVFANCSSLKTVTYTNELDYIPAGAFYACEKLTTVTNLQRVERIGSDAFSECWKLSSITFPSCLISIGSDAFEFCISLGTVTIPKKVEKISSGAFKAAATRFQVASKNKFYSSKNGVLYNKKGTRLIQVPTNATGTLHIPKEVKKINRNSLRYCEIKKLVFAKGITTLDKYIFQDMNRLQTIVLPETLSELKYDSVSPAYLNCNHITSIQIAQTNPHFSSVDGVLYNKDQSKMLFYPIGKKGELTLPDNLRKLNYQLKTNKLTSIQVTANNSKFTSVDGVLYDNRTRKMLCYPLYKGTYRIPKSVNDVNYLYQIQDIVKLKSIQVSGKNNKFYAKDGVLFSNSNDTLLYYPPQKAGAYVVPESTAYIDPDAFNYAKKLTKLTISKNVSRHAYTTYSFENCSNLQEIVVKQGKLNSINMSFWYCDKLKKITLPSSIMTMNMYGLPEGVTIYGWNNTKAKSIAKKAKCKFVSLGTIPNKVSGIRVKKIIDKYQISWNASSNVSGYQVYTKYETIADIKGSSNTKCNIKDIEDYDTIYIRAYTIKNKKKIYGKAAKYSVR